MLTLARTETFQNLQLNAGIFLVDFDYSQAQNKEQLLQKIKEAIETPAKHLGATKGGGSFTATPTIRRIEADGMRAPIVGSQVIDEWQVKLSTTLMEVNPDNLKRVFATGEEDTVETSLKRIRIRQDLKDSDYIEKLCWVGDIAGGKYVLINLENVLNTAGATLSFADKGEGTLGVEFVAHQKNISQDYLPCEVIFFDK